MEHNSQDAVGSNAERPPPQQQDHPQEKQQVFHRNLSHRAARNTIPAADLVRLARRKYLPVEFEDLQDLPPAALSREANHLYPLISHHLPPFQYVNPATVMAPTFEEARLNIRRLNSPRLPVATVGAFGEYMAAKCRAYPARSSHAWNSNWLSSA